MAGKERKVRSGVSRAYECRAINLFAPLLFVVVRLALITRKLILEAGKGHPRMALENRPKAPGHHPPERFATKSNELRRDQGFVGAALPFQLKIPPEVSTFTAKPTQSRTKPDLSDHREPVKVSVRRISRKGSQNLTGSRCK